MADAFPVGGISSSNSSFCGLTTIPASATIIIGSRKFSTPEVISVSVNRTRGQLISAASATFHAPGIFSTGIDAGDSVVIKFFGETVFTGFIKRLNIGPSFRCDGELIIRIQAEDVLFRIDNKNFTRRQKLAGMGPIAFITSIYKRTYTGFDDPTQRHDISNTASPIEYLTPTLNMSEHTALIKGGETNVIGENHPVTKLADKPGIGGASSGGGGAFILHDHTSLDLSSPHAGGPARAVFGSK